MSEARGVPAGNGLAWLTRGFDTVRKHPGTFSLAFLLFLFAILVPIGLQLTVNHLMPAAQTSIAVQLGWTLVVLFVAALLQVGMLRMVDSLERTGSANPTSLFATFGDTDLMARTLGFAAIAFLVYMVFAVVVLTMLGPDMLAWYGKALTQPLTAAAEPPPVTGSPWLAAAFGVAGSIAIVGINTFGYAQVALTRAGGFEAFMDGLRGSARNALPILVNIVVTIVSLVLLAIPMVLLMVLLGFIGGLVHPGLAVALAAPVYVAYLVGICAVIYATMYHAWRDVFGDGSVAAAPTTSPQLQA